MQSKSSLQHTAPGVLFYCCYRTMPNEDPTWLLACTPCRLCGAGVCCAVMVVLIAEVAVGLRAGQAFVSRERRLEQNLTSCTLSGRQLASGETFCGFGQGPQRTPANMTATMWFPECTSTYLIEEMAEFNRQQPWHLVAFPSRHGEQGQEDVRLQAWWLPVADPKAPRIVVAHGNLRNFNDWSVQLAAYMLRSMGFAVLLPSLRDHGFSTAGTESDEGLRATWGWAYHLDLLGAWDYLVQDPDNRLGGPLSPEQVGLQGIALGAFAASIASGLEPRVPGIWLDSLVADPRNLLLFQLRRVVGSILAPLFLHVAWFCANQLAGVELDLFTPARVMPSRRGEAVCNVAAVADKHDSAVPDSETELLMELLRSEPAKSGYRVLYFDKAEGHCGSEDHAVLLAWTPNPYRQKLCRFWTKTFQKPLDFCNLEELPLFAMDVGATSSWLHPPPRPAFG